MLLVPLKDVPHKVPGQLHCYTCPCEEGRSACRPIAWCHLLGRACYHGDRHYVSLLCPVFSWVTDMKTQWAEVPSPSLMMGHRCLLLPTFCFSQLCQFLSWLLIHSGLIFLECRVRTEVLNLGTDFASHGLTLSLIHSTNA